MTDKSATGQTGARAATAPEAKAPRPAPEAKAPRPAPEVVSQPAASGEVADGLRVPIPTVGVRMAHVPVPHLGLAGPRSVASDVAHGVSTATATVRSRLPQRERVLYFGGLGALAATGLVSWPVAAAIGAGVWVAGRVRTGSDRVSV